MNKNIECLRNIMIAELKTVNEYSNYLTMMDDEPAKNVVVSIIEEELVHVGEAQEALRNICGIQDAKVSEGVKEAKEIIHRVTPLTYTPLMDRNGDH